MANLNFGKLLLWLCILHLNTCFGYSASLSFVSADSSVARQHAQKAANLLQTGEVDSAVYHFRQAASLYAENQMWKSFLTNAVQAGKQWVQKEQNDEAIAYLEQALTLIPSVELDENAQMIALSLYYWLGRAYTQKGEYVKALEYCLQSCKQGEAIYGVNDTTLAQNYIITGYLSNNLHLLDQALTYNKKYIAVCKKRNDGPVQFSNAYNNIGITYDMLGEHQTALEYYQQAKDRIQTMEQADKQALIQSNINIGATYFGIKDYKSALTYFEEALALAEQANEPYYIDAIYNNLGGVYQGLEDYQRMLYYTQQTVEMREQMFGKSHPHTGSALYALGDAYFFNKNYDTARIYYQQSLENHLAVFGEKHPFIAEVHQAKGKIHMEKKNYRQALGYFQQSINAVVHDFEESDPYQEISINHQEVIDPSTLLKAITLKARAFRALSQQENQRPHLQAAFTAYTQAMQLADTMRQALDHVDAKLFLAGKHAYFYEEAIQTANLLHKHTFDKKYLAFIHRVMEQNKANILLENLIASEGKASLGTAAASLLSRENALKAKIGFYNQLIFDEKHKAAGIDSASLRQWNSEVFALKRRLDSIDNEIRQELPQYYQSKYSESRLSLSEVQESLLAEDELLLEYFAGDSSTYLLAVDKNNADCHVIDHTQAVNTQIQALLEATKQRDYTAYTSSAHRLYTLLLKNVLENAGKYQQLVIIPDKMLGYVPFEILLKNPGVSQIENYADLAYLLQDYNIQYNYSVNLLAYQRPATRENTAPRIPFLGFAPSFSKTSNPLLATRSAADSMLLQELEHLPQAEEEVQVIAGILQGDFHAGSTATEQQFKAQAHNARILHLASHTIINEENPLYSKLVFSPNQDTLEDGLLHTYELYNMQLNADLVTLSACNTGIGKIYKGEGVMSLARGFMYAGVPNVLMSLWSVPDRSTSQIMQYFYEAMEAGHTKAEALRQAKLQYLQEADANTAAPFYWGAFVYLGKEEKTDFFSSYWVGVGILVIVMAFAIGIRMWRLSGKKVKV